MAGIANQMWGGIKRFAYENSYVQALTLDTKEAKAEREQFDHLPLWKKVGTAAYFGINCMVKSVFIGLPIAFGPKLLVSFLKGGKRENIEEPQGVMLLDPKNRLIAYVAAPILEELAFRCLQLSIWQLQETAIHYLPKEWQSNKVFKVLTSNSFRAIVTELAFAAIHLRNAHAYGGMRDAAGQALTIALKNASLAVVYERTGSIRACIIAHCVHNFIVFESLLFINSKLKR